MGSTRKTQEVKGALTKKGFELSKNNSNNHIWYEFTHNGKFVSRTKFSHSHSEIGDSLIGQISKQLKMDNKKQFLEFVDCTFSQEDYIKLLKKKNEL